MSTLIAPSVLSANFGHLSKDVAMVRQSEADWFHVDVMDGVFVPNISFGFPVMDVLSKEAQKPLDVHLMIVQPERYIEAFAKLGAYMITVHYEACIHLDRVIQQIKQAGCKAGVAINPHTPVSLLENVCNEIDLALVMSVNPGFGGQKFIENSLSKVSDLKAMREKRQLDFKIEVDGGINLDTGKRLVAAGADVLVTGSTVFNAENPMEMISQLKKL